MKLTCYPRYLRSFHLFNAQTWIIFHFPSLVKVFFVSFLINVTTYEPSWTISSFHFSQHKHQVSIHTTLSSFPFNLSLFKLFSSFVILSFTIFNFVFLSILMCSLQKMELPMVRYGFKIRDVAEEDKIITILLFAYFTKSTGS